MECNSTVEELSGPPERAWLVPALACGVATLFLLVMGSGSIGKLSVASALGGVAIAMLLLMSLRNALFIYFLYLLFDGAIKVNSNYHPILHVGQDLLLILLMARSCWEQGSGGFQKITRTPHFGFFLTFCAWILVQYVNPFGLGLLPSIAGTKVYISMLCLFFLIFHHIPREDVSKLLRWILFLATLESGLAVLEYLYGQSWMLALHPRYSEMISTQFGGIFYRPFGTTAIPGGPSVWAMLAAPIAGYFLEKPDARKIDRVLPLLFIAVAVPTLIFCQVRVSMLVASAGFLLTMLRPTRGIFIRVAGSAVLGALLVYSVSAWFNSNTTENFRWISGLSAEQREILFQRTTSLSSGETYMSARGGSWTEAMALADMTWLGIGLSRVGAASEPWAARIQADPYFGSRWAFADNLFKAIFTELGIFGLGAWFLFIGASLMTLYRGAFSFSRGQKGDPSVVWMSATFVTLLVICGIGNEGILYNPVSGIFWTLLALGMKEASYVV